MRQRADCLLATWHPAHGPASLDFEPGVKRLGLKVSYLRVTRPHMAEVELDAALGVRFANAAGQQVLAPEDPLLLGEGAHPIVFVTDPRQVDLPESADLQAQLGLTPAECRVTHGLAQDATYREVAGTFGIGEETVRSHVNSIHAKTRTNNKAGLTRLVLSLTRAAV